VHCHHVDIAELLLNAGAHVDAVDTGGWSACHVAAQECHTDVMRVLLAHRPNLALKNNEGKTALEQVFSSDCWNTKRDRDDFALLCVLAGAPLDNRADLCLLAAASTTAIQALIDRNIVISDLRDRWGSTPLHIATRDCAALTVLSKLVECGVDVDLEVHLLGSNTPTCASVAVRQGNASKLRLFLLAGADVNRSNLGGESLLHHSVGVDDHAFMCAKLLLAAGADVAARDSRGRTALLRAALQWPMMPFVHLMLAAGANLDAEHENDEAPGRRLAARRLTIDPEQVEMARREIAKVRLDFVRHRACQVCIGLQSRGLDALQMCEVLLHSCGPVAHLIAFHQWWKIATTVKHFNTSKLKFNHESA
jgi:ankyrin repeat protein